MINSTKVYHSVLRKKWTNIQMYKLFILKCINYKKKQCLNKLINHRTNHSNSFIKNDIFSTCI